MYYAHLQLRNRITGHALKPSNCRSTRRPWFWRPVPWIVNKITQQSEIMIKTAEQKFPLSLLVRKKNHVTSLFFCFVIFFFFFYTFNATNHLLARQKMLWKLSQLTSVDWIDCVLNQVNEGLNIAVLTWVSSQDSERSVRGDEQGENQGSDHGYLDALYSHRPLNTLTQWDENLLVKTE